MTDETPKEKPPVTFLQELIRGSKGKVVEELSKLNSKQKWGMIDGKNIHPESIMQNYGILLMKLSQIQAEMLCYTSVLELLLQFVPQEAYEDFRKAHEANVDEFLRIIAEAQKQADKPDQKLVLANAAGGIKGIRG